MDAEPEESPFARAALILVAVLALYVLSVGPVVHCVVRSSPRSEHAARSLIIIYSPLVWTADHCQPLGKALNWYVHLWEE